MIKKIFAYTALVGMIVSANSGVVSAHVVVRPAEVETAAFQTFTTSVPNELEQPTVKVRVVMPDGVGRVSPTVKPGWTIDTVKSGEGEDADVKEVTWSGGSIPAGQRDDFTFSAQAPETETILQWKAYQTYADGTEVAWDQAPSNGGHGDGATKPFSETEVVSELAAAATSDEKPENASSPTATTALALSVAALLVAVYSFTKATAQKPSKSKK